MRPCRPWLGSIDKDGYGVEYFKDEQGKWRSRRAHRAAYEREVGPVPLGLILDHLCHEPSSCPGGKTCPHRRCTEVSHLHPTTRRANVERSSHPHVQAHNRGECVRGHAMTPENTYISPRGHKQCRECSRLREANRPPRNRNRTWTL